MKCRLSEVSWSRKSAASHEWVIFLVVVSPLVTRARGFRPFKTCFSYLEGFYLEKLVGITPEKSLIRQNIVLYVTVSMSSFNSNLGF